MRFHTKARQNLIFQNNGKSYTAIFLIDVYIREIRNEVT